MFYLFLCFWRRRFRFFNRSFTGDACSFEQRNEANSISPASRWSPNESAVPLSPDHIPQTPAAHHTSQRVPNQPVYYYCYIQSIKSLYPISHDEKSFSLVLKCTRRVLVALIALPCIVAKLIVDGAIMKSKLKCW